MSNRIRCAIYTRKSTEEGLEQDFNSLDAQREACESFIRSQKGLGWSVIRKSYDDGGISGGTMDRPALRELLDDIERSRVDLIVVYKVDRLTRSLTDFSRMIETFDAREVSFVSVTQQFNTASSMGRLTLNVLLSFAQFEREVTAERIRDKIAASKKKGMWMGGQSPVGYDAIDKKLIVNEGGAKVVRALYALCLEVKSVRKLKLEADRLGYLTKWRGSGDQATGGKPFTRGHLYQLLHNPVYVGKVSHKGKTYPGQHKPIIDRETWEAVQSLLSVRAPARHSQNNIRQRCLLTGLVFDEDGERLSPSYCQKKKRRYRYYISGHLMHGSGKTDGWRIPARQLEEAVSQGLSRFLADDVRIVDAIHGAADTTTQIQTSVRAAAKLSRRIGKDLCEETTQVIRKVLGKVVVESDRLRIAISRTGMAECLGGVNSRGESAIVFDVPISIQRRGVERKIILHGDARATFHDDRLIRLVRDTRQWFAKIRSGEVTTVREIACEANMDEGDVSRFLPLAFLAPDIVEAILNGRQPTELAAEKLKRLRLLPQSWGEQRTLLGFDA